MITLGLNQEKLKKLFEDMEISIKRLDKFIERETKGETKRTLSSQLVCVVDLNELDAMKELFYQQMDKGRLF